MPHAYTERAAARVQAATHPELPHHGEMVQRPDYLRKAQGLDPFGEVGTTGLRQFGGFVLEEWLLALQGRRAAWVWREMLDNDPTVGAIMYALRWLSEGIEWPVEEGSSAETAEFVESCMHDMSHTWNDFVSEVLSFLPYGWSFHEEVMKRRQGKQPGPPLLQENAGNYTQENVSFKASSAYKDGKVGWRKIPIRAQETMLRWLFDGYSGIAGMKQIDWHGGNHDIPIQKALLFRTQTTRNNPEGRSILRNAYTSYFALKNIKAIEGIGIERDLAGIPVMTPPEGVNVFAPGQEDLYTKVQNVVTSIRRDEHEGVVLPEAGWKLELLSAGGSRQFDTDKVIRRYRSDIATSMLADFVLIGQDSVGSYAMVDVKSDLWGMALDGVMDLICEVMNRYAIPRLLELNGINDPDPPQITHGRARKIDLERVGAFLQAISLAGAPIPWSIELLKALFLDAGLPINFEEHSDPTELPTVKSPEEQLAEQRAAAEKVIPGNSPGTGGPDQEARQPLAKAAQSEVADGTLIDLSPHFQARHRMLSAQLDSEISAALAELGNKAADVYGAIAEKAAGRPSYGGLQRVVGRVMRSLNVANWLNTRLLPILKNHAGRTAADTARTIQTQIDLEVHIGEEDARAIVAKGGEDLGMRDIEPQVRQAILKAVRQGLERGENPTRTAQRIREQVPAGRFVHAGAKYRSQLISREQTARAMRQSSLAAYKSNPNITAVELRDGIYGPPRSDQTCIARDGDIVPIERADSVHAEHILCTLSMSPVVSGTLRERVPEVLAA